MVSNGGPPLENEEPTFRRSPRPLIAVVALLMVLAGGGALVARMQNSGAAVERALAEMLHIRIGSPQTRYSIDVVETPHASYVVAGIPPAIHVARGDTVRVDGWAVDDATQGPAKGVIVRIDDKESVQAKYGLPRSDVARALGSSRFTNVGFTASFGTAPLEPGPHELSIEIIGSGLTYDAQRRIQFVVL
jgi:hypothetical protein